MTATARRSGSLALLALLTLGSCQTAADQGDGDHGVSAVQFQDIVVPDGMTLVDRYHESYSREAGAWRFGHFEYVGAPDVAEACSHLLLRMPQHRWQLAADESAEKDSRQLRFERGRHVANYTLQRADGVTRMVIEYRTEIEDR